MFFHLPGHLASDLERAHLGPEGTTERAFDEASDLFLEAAENAHCSAAGAFLRASLDGAFSGFSCYASPIGVLPAVREALKASATEGASATTPAAIAPSTAAPGVSSVLACPACRKIVVADAVTAVQTVTSTSWTASGRMKVVHGSNTAASAQMTA